MRHAHHLPQALAWARLLHHHHLHLIRPPRLTVRWPLKGWAPTGPGWHPFS
jgi:hypothetical protein